MKFVENTVKQGWPRQKRGQVRNTMRRDGKIIEHLNCGEKRLDETGSKRGPRSDCAAGVPHACRARLRHARQVQTGTLVKGQKELGCRARASRAYARDHVDKEAAGSRGLLPDGNDSREQREREGDTSNPNNADFAAF